jgi:hypothetical protein
MDEEVKVWLDDCGLPIYRLHAKRPYISVEYLADAACVVYERRFDLRPIRYGWTIWEIAEDLMNEGKVLFPSRIGLLKSQLEWQMRPWYIKIFDGGVYPEGTRG